MADPSTDILQREIAAVGGRARTDAALLRSNVATLRLQIRQLTQSRSTFIAAFATAALLGAVAGLRGYRLRPRRGLRA